jgi:hypothetical protein
MRRPRRRADATNHELETEKPVKALSCNGFKVAARGTAAYIERRRRSRGPTPRHPGAEDVMSARDYQVVRKEKPLPPAKPPQKSPPAPTGIRAPGSSSGTRGSGMVCGTPALV